MSDLGSEAELLAGCCGVTAAYNGNSGALCKSLCYGNGTSGKSGVLKYAHRSVPYYGLSRKNCIGEELRSLRSYVKSLLVSGDVLYVNVLDVDRSIDGIREASRNCGIYGKKKVHAILLSLSHHLTAVVKLGLVKKRVTNAKTLCSGKGERHTATDDECIYLGEKVIYNVELISNLSTAEDSHEGTLGVRECLTHNGDLLLNKVAANCGDVVSNARGRCVCSVSRTECVIYKYICIRSELLSKISTVLSLSCIKSGVLKKNCIAGLKSRNLSLSILADNVLGKGNLLCTEKLVKSYCNGLKSKLLLIVLKSLLKILACSCLLLLSGKSLNCLLLLLSKSKALGKDAVGLTHMRAKNNLRSAVKKVLNSGECSYYSLVGGDNSVLHRNVEVATNEHCLTGYLDILNSLLVISCHFYISLKYFSDTYITTKRSPSQ